MVRKRHRDAVLARSRIAARGIKSMMDCLQRRARLRARPVPRVPTEVGWDFDRLRTATRERYYLSLDSDRNPGPVEDWEECILTVPVGGPR